MWAFVIHDRRNNKLFGARDRFGIKPFHYCNEAGRFIFASEIKSIRASGYYRDQLNEAVASSFLVDGRLDETDETFYRGIRKLPPGCAFEYSLEGSRFREYRYWDIRNAVTSLAGDPGERFAELFEDAVRVHMRSDVPVGIHLSGGLDSTSIASCFSYISPEFDESEYIRATVAQTGARLIELETSPEKLWADLQQMLWFQDEPVHTLTALVSYQLMRATAKHGIKVILNGQGGDETLAGYPNYFRHYWNDVEHAKGLRQAWREMGAFYNVHAGAKPARLMAQLFMRRSFYQLWKSSLYRGFVGRRRQKRARNGWFAPDLLRELPKSAPRTPADLSGALAYTQMVEPLPLYLRLEDRNSMAHSIEARLPFLDYRLAEFAYCLPDDWKLRGPWNKFVLREAMKGRIPESARVRPDKMGFPVPAREWFAGKLFEPVMDVLSSRQTIESGRYRMDIVRRDVDRHRKGEADFSDKLFGVAQFELWAKDLANSGSDRGADSDGIMIRPPRASYDAAGFTGTRLSITMSDSTANAVEDNGDFNEI